MWKTTLEKYIYFFRKGRLIEAERELKDFQSFLSEADLIMWKLQCHSVWLDEEGVVEANITSGKMNAAQASQRREAIDKDFLECTARFF